MVAVVVSAFSIIAALFIKQVQLRGSNDAPPAPRDPADPAEADADAAALPAAGMH
jgi:hypothetical protein